MRAASFILCLFVCVACTFARPQFQAVGPSEPYDFNYKVEYPPTNTYFGQNEHGDVAGNKQGTYYVLLPDGRTMTVNYIADAAGYNPKISFQGGGAAAAAATVIGRYH